MKSFAFRKATEKDLKTATALIEQAKVFLAGKWRRPVADWLPQ